MPWLAFGGRETVVKGEGVVKGEVKGEMKTGASEKAGDKAAFRFVEEGRRLAGMLMGMVVFGVGLVEEVEPPKRLIRFGWKSCSGMGGLRVSGR
jgi:hypothetical protein